ncbi:hypothetical protein T07_2807 [Trichinella nelsoni]|uniref:Uncharacterized protein n=1 Tax=Trichinella nelsoni TaxID=6336 RepID=A0A0V0S894_9BILA|nr:hypothetical protein T07_2807 [Trichinella nelsoni]
MSLSYILYQIVAVVCPLFMKAGHKIKTCRQTEILEDKKGGGGAIWTNLDVTSVIKQNDHIESCPVDEHLAYID